MSKKSTNVFKSAALVTIMMLCFKMIGFVKQSVIASVFGATAVTDAYFIAWGFVSGICEAIVKALLVSIVAVYTSVRINKGKEYASRMINGLLEILVPIFCAAAAVLFFTAPLLSHILAPSYEGEQLITLTSFIRALLPLLLFGLLELIVGAILDSYKSFYIPRLQSLIYSLSVILACFALTSWLGVWSLAAGQYLSSFVFSIILLINVKKYHTFRFTSLESIPEIKEVFVTAIPLFIGNSALQINQIVDKSITSGLGVGAASALTYCHTLEQFVTNIMIVNIGNVLFANFSEYVARNQINEIKVTLSKALNILICLLLGTSAITIVCSEEIVSIVYYRGSFSYEAVKLTAIALTGYAISFAAVAVRDLSVKSLYSFKDTKLPMKASLISICINVVLSLILSRYVGIFGISFATSISAVIGMIINARGLKKYIHDYRFSQHIGVLLKCLPGAVVLFVTAMAIKSMLNFGALVCFTLVCIIGFPVYFTILYICRITEVRNIVGALLKKLRSRS